ncbi:tRNA dimethylallyltransferase, mitochondrial-like protein, partial [Sarcoptes scabiei]
IDDIIARNKYPIVVGGTNYYIESIIYHNLIDSESVPFSNQQTISSSVRETIENQSRKIFPIDTVEELLSIKITTQNLKCTSNEKLHKFLSCIDPRSAEILHINDRRKIIRSLQVFQQTGHSMSEILDEQRSRGSKHGGPLRFENSIILWLDCEKEVLEKRLDKRVDDMIEDGLIQELITFHENYNQKRLDQDENIDYTEGIFQTIGLKEFHQYLVMDQNDRDSPQGRLKLENGIELFRQRTKGYVNKQLKWLRRRFLIDDQIRKVPNVYRLNTTNLDEWNENVLEKAIMIVQKSIE